MATSCPSCGADVAVPFSIEVGNDGWWDEIVLRVEQCAGCGRRGLGVYRESRRGGWDESDWNDEQFDCPGEVWDALSRLMASCPNPRSWKCGCAAHVRCRVLDEHGNWWGVAALIGSFGAAEQDASANAERRAPSNAPTPEAPRSPAAISAFEPSSPSSTRPDPGYRKTHAEWVHVEEAWAHVAGALASWVYGATAGGDDTPEQAVLDGLAARTRLEAVGVAARALAARAGSVTLPELEGAAAASARAARAIEALEHLTFDWYQDGPYATGDTVERQELLKLVRGARAKARTAEHKTRVAGAVEVSNGIGHLADGFNALAKLDAGLASRAFQTAGVVLHAWSGGGLDMMDMWSVPDDADCSLPRNLFARVLAQPEADEPREACAAWLTERGDPQGRLIEAQLELRRVNPHSPRADELRREARSLIDDHGPQWAGAIARHVGYYEFVRGFVEVIQVSAEQFLRDVKLLYSAAPVLHLILTEVHDLLPLVVASRQVRRLRSLSCFNQRLDDEAVRVLTAPGSLSNLRYLDLGANQITDAGVELLVSVNERFPHLAYVNVAGNPAVDPCEGYGTDWMTGAIVPESVHLPPRGVELERKYGVIPWFHAPSRLESYPGGTWDL